MTAALLAGRHALPNLLLAFAAIGLCSGGAMLWASIVLVLVLGGLADEALGDEPAPMPTLGATFCTANLYAAVPLLLAVSLAHWRSAATSSLASVAATLLVGYLYAVVGATAAHELMHRVHDRAALFCSCLLLAFTFNTGFTLFHVQGHHRNVALWRDPASARRGETCLAFLRRTIAAQSMEAFRFEAERLRREGRGVLSPRNRFLRRLLFSLAIVASAGLIGGAACLASFLAAAFFGRIFHEMVNY